MLQILIGGLSGIFSGIGMGGGTILFQQQFQQL